MTPHSLDYCLENLQQLAASAGRVKLWTELNSRTCAVFQINETEEQPRDVPIRLLRSLEVGRTALFGDLLPSQFFFTPHQEVQLSSLVPRLHSPAFYRTVYKSGVIKKLGSGVWERGYSCQ